MSDLNPDIHRIYRAIVADANLSGIDRKAALDQLVHQVRPLVKAGVVDLDIDHMIRAEGRRCDEADGKKADHILKQIAEGADSFDVDDDPVLDLVVTLGGGFRKTWRHVNRNDLEEMDGLRYRNLHAQQLGYHNWRVQFEAWRPILLRRATVGEAVSVGDLPVLDGLLFESGSAS